MTNRNRIPNLLALLLASAVLFAFLAACSCGKTEPARKREKRTEAALPVLTAAPVLRPTPTPVPRTTPEPTPKVTPRPTAGPTLEPTPAPTAEPTVDIAGSWKGRMNIAPLVAVELVNSLGSFDMDIGRIEFVGMEVDFTADFYRDGSYRTEVDRKQVQNCVDRMIDNNWEAIKRAIIEYAAEVYGKDPSEITESDIFGKGKIIDITGVRSWGMLKTMAGLLKYTMDTNSIAREYTAEGSYTVEGSRLTMDNFGNYREYTVREEGGSVSLSPVSPRPGDLGAKVFPLALSRVS
jgi:hypothetical protein